MFGAVVEAKSKLAETVSSLDAACLSAGDAAALFAELIECERLAAAGRTLVAKRIADSNLWRESGDRSAAQWLARKTGSSVGGAIATLETAERLGSLRSTDEAFRAGKLSEPQVREIAAAVAASPSSEPELLAAAERESLVDLKKQCERVKAAAVVDEQAEHDRVHKARYLRSRSHDGGRKGEFFMTNADYALLEARMRPFENQVFEKARIAGTREGFDAYALDALLAMAAAAGSGGVGSKPPAKVHVRIDHTAFTRGHTIPGETCEVAGVGPIPVSMATELMKDAFLAAIVVDGTDVRAVSHMGRHVPAVVRTAVEERDRTCAVPGCSCDSHLEIDHVKGVAERGPTCYENLRRLCRFHHHQKTHLGYRLTGPPGAEEWKQVGGREPPDDG